MGLADSFVKVGVPYVIGMSWSISDAGAIVLAEEFYNRLMITKDPGGSLQRARLKTGERFDWKDPVWAAPIMYG
jgi:CHAT domain-containing protein